MLESISDESYMRRNRRPAVRAQDNNTERTILQVLLKLKVLIGCYEGFEAVFLCDLKESPILHPGPAHVLSGENIMACQQRTNIMRQVLIKQYLHAAVRFRCAKSRTP